MDTAFNYYTELLVSISSLISPMCTWRIQVGCIQDKSKEVGRWVCIYIAKVITRVRLKLFIYVMIQRSLIRTLTRIWNAGRRINFFKITVIPNWTIFIFFCIRYDWSVVCIWPRWTGTSVKIMIIVTDWQSPHVNKLLMKIAQLWISAWYVYVFVSHVLMCMWTNLLKEFKIYRNFNENDSPEQWDLRLF